MLVWNNYDESIPLEMIPGFKLFLRKNCEYSRKRFEYRVAETNELNFLTKYDFSKFICLDVGANIGYWTVFLGSKLSAKQIHCFEPDPKLFSILAQNIVLNEIEIVTVANQYAVCDFEKDMELYLLPEHSGDNRPYFMEGRISIKVKGIPIDQYVSDNNLSRVDFIKIDIQGGEPLALDGCEKTIAYYKPVMMIEFSRDTAADCGNGLKQRLLNLIKTEKMSLFIIKDNELNLISMDFLEQYEGNIFISKNDSWLFKNY